MIELGAQFAFIDDVGQAHMVGAVDQLEGGLDIGMLLPDHLQHQQLVEIGVEQAAHDRVEPPIMVVGAGGDIGEDHEEPDGQQN